jgi:hypothetical protein
VVFQTVIRRLEAALGLEPSPEPVLEVEEGMAVTSRADRLARKVEKEAAKAAAKAAARAEKEAARAEKEAQRAGKKARKKKAAAPAPLEIAQGVPNGAIENAPPIVNGDSAEEDDDA